MILFWILAGLLTLAAALVLALPLFDVRRLKSDDSFALEVYRDQLTELVRDEARGLLSADQAKAAQVEIERRILALDPAPAFRPAQPPGQYLTLSMAVILPLAGFLFYLSLGQPQLPGQPLSERGQELALRLSPDIVQLARKLEQSPSDAQAWIDLGHAYGAHERARDAADAFAKAMALGRGEPALLTGYARALILAENGVVVVKAREALARALAADAADPMARFFLALARAQDGDLEGALADWIVLEATLPRQSELRPTLSRNIDKAAVELGRDPMTLPGRTIGPSDAEGPGPADIEAAARMSPTERDAFIRGMVERLADRLKDNPADIDGWLRLARAYEILEEGALARAAWAKAAELAPARLDIQLDFASALIRGRPDLDQELPEGFAEAVKRIRTLDGNNPLGLFYAGMVERQAGRSEAARDLWHQVLALLPEGSPERGDLQRQIDALDRPKP